MKNEPKLLIPLKQDREKPITADKLRTLPDEIETAVAPAAVINKMREATNNVHFLPEMLSISQAVEITNLSYEYLRYLCYSGKINHIRCGRKYMIDSSSLAEFIKRGGAD